MAVVNSLHDLCPEELGLKLWHLTIGFHFQVAMQTPPINKLHNYENLLMRFKSLVELCYVRVIKLFHDLLLPFNRFTSVWLKKLNLFIDLYCDLLI